MHGIFWNLFLQVNKYDPKVKKSWILNKKQIDEYTPMLK